MLLCSQGTFQVNHGQQTGYYIFQFVSSSYSSKLHKRWLLNAREQAVLFLVCFGLQNVCLNYTGGTYVFVAVKSWLNNVLGDKKSMGFYSSRKQLYEKLPQQRVGEEQRNKNRFLVPKQHPLLAPVQCAPCSAFFSFLPFLEKQPVSVLFFFSFKTEGLGLCNPACTHSLVFLPACIPVRQISPNKPFCEALSVTACLRKKMMKKTSLPIIRANQQAKALKASLRLNSWSYFM